MAIPSHLRRINERRIIATLLRLGAASRADLAKATGLSQPTAGKIVDELLASRLLQEDPAPSNGFPTAKRMGRPSQFLRLERQTPRFLAIQLGVVHTRLALLPVAVQDTDPWSAQFPTPSTPDEWLQQLARVNPCANRKSMPGHSAAPPRLPVEPDALLLSVPGVVDERTGQFLLSPNLPWTQSANLADLLRRFSPAPLCIVQEIRALALGHQAIDPNAGDFLLVDFGDGIGAAAIVNRELYVGPTPLSGELGHTPVLHNARPCGCGATGCVETLVSRKGLLQSFSSQTRHPQSWPALIDYLASHPLPAWLTSALDAAAVTIAGALNVLGLRHVVITGSLTELPPAVTDYLAHAVTRGAMFARFGQVTCQPAPRRRTAGLLAAALTRLLLPDPTLPP